MLCEGYVLLQQLCSNQATGCVPEASLMLEEVPMHIIPEGASVILSTQ